MTLDQFLAHLATHERGRGWVVNGRGYIRRHETGDAPVGVCPWAAVLESGALVPITLVPDIMDAADRRPRHDRALRARLLVALGLEETRA